jgi:hypothetical protein
VRLPRDSRCFWVWSCFAVLLAVVALPVLSTVLPPLFDYPNHLARMRVLAEGGNRFYAVRWAPLPNLAEDLIVPPLARLIPLETAGELFVIMIFGLIAGGTLCLNRAATGGWRMWPLAAFLLLYNRSLLWGFLNYLFGLGAALLAAALWLSWESRPPLLRVVASAFAALVCFFCHLAAFGVYGATICGIELPPAAAELYARRWPALSRRAAIFAAQFVIPAALLLHWRQQTADRGISYDGLRKFDLLFSVFDNYSRGFDIACFALFASLLIWLAWTGRLGLDPRLGSAAGLLFAAYLAAPDRVFGGSGLDHRLPLAVLLLGIAGSAPRFPRRRAAVVIGAAAALLLALRIAVIERVWLRADRLYSADLAGIDALPRGARLAVAYPPDMIHVVAVPEVHLPAMAVVRRDAFVPTLFALPGQQPIVLRPPWAAVADMAQPPVLWAALTGAAPALPLLPVLAQFDDVAVVGHGHVRRPLSRCLEPVFAAPTFRIFALRHGVRCTAAARDQLRRQSGAQDNMDCQRCRVSSLG